MAKRGRPFEPGNKFGRGRPRGSRNKVTGEAKKLLEEYSLPLLRKAIADALQNAGPMLRKFVDHILGPAQAPPVDIGALPVGTPEEVSRAVKTVVRKVSTGQIASSVGHDLVKLLEILLRAIETADLDKRLQVLEPG